MPPKLTHLHTHSHYSLLNAIPKIPDLVKAAKEDGNTALALTDLGNMYGAIEFYKECKKVGIKPILGVEFFVAPRTIQQTEFGTDDVVSNLILLAKNFDGYQNLLQLVSKSFFEGFFHKPRIDKELIKKFKSGLVCILPAINGAHSSMLASNLKERAEEELRFYKEVFGDDFYLEITRHTELEGHEKLIKQIESFGNKLKIKLVASHEVYYLKKSDNFARELVKKIQEGTPVLGDEAERPDDYSFISQATFTKYFKNNPEAILANEEITNKCNLELSLGKWILPNYPKNENETYDELLRTKAEAGFEKRKLEKTPETIKRMEYELDIIKQKGFASYFLVVADLLEYAKSAKIYTNTRGSAAGSLVSYLTGIITINPLVYNLPFERFLNPGRPSAPDIDMDLADNRRDDLITYAIKKYGEDFVAQIGTFGSMAARAVVRDVARALGHSYSKGDQIAKAIPFGAQGFTMTIDKALEIEPDLKKMYDKDSETKEIINLSKIIEGNARHVGVHAAGVVISPKPLIELVPMQFDPKATGKIITQYDMYSIADEYGGVGLLKFDFLGLKNLTVLADSIQRVLELHGIEIDADFLPIDDKKTFAMLAEGRTMGVFQLASPGMTRHLVDLKPSAVHDINAMVALYRPGPMEFIPQYIERKHNPSKVHYLDPRLEKILKPTFGILIYQDDVMLIAVELAGYSWGEADKFRKAMGKKIPEEMQAQKDKFLKGCTDRGMLPNAATSLWEQIETFAAYGFNKSHAASYGNLSYKTAYMKANWPLEFMSALFTADAGNVDEIAKIADECKIMKIPILPPDINESSKDFTVDVIRRGIRFGLMTIKNFGEGIADSIVAERNKNGKFISVADFLTRVGDKNLNKRSLEALTKVGALDSLENRSLLISNTETMLAYHKEAHSGNTAQTSLFGNTVSALKLKPSDPISRLEILKYEKDLLGLYVSGHPLDEYEARLKGKPSISEMMRTTREGVTTVIAGLVTEVKVITTKGGEKMAFVRISDKTTSIESVIFPRIFAEKNAILVVGNCILIKGRLSRKGNDLSFVAETLKSM